MAAVGTNLRGGGPAISRGDGSFSADAVFVGRRPGQVVLTASADHLVSEVAFLVGDGRRAVPSVALGSFGKISSPRSWPKLHAA